jgi:hypothetical protein
VITLWINAILEPGVYPLGKKMTELSATGLYKPGITLIAIILIALAFSGIIDKTGEQYTDAAFKRALVTFGVARGLNGAISVAQGTEISISPGGLGLNLTPGEILDPVNDLIERFSWVMLMSSTSLGIQKIFLNISSALGASIIVAFIILPALLVLWQPTRVNPTLRKALYKLALMVLILRFAVPVAAIGSEWVYSYFLSKQYQESTDLLENTRTEITDLNTSKTQTPSQDAEDAGLIERATRWLDSASENLGVEARMERYKEAAAKASEHAINLIVVFVIQTIILPLLFLWLVVRSIRKVWD